MSTLFVGQVGSAVTHYRCELPAIALDADWIGVDGQHRVLAGCLGEEGNLGVPVIKEYDTVVIHAEFGRDWTNYAHALRRAGTRVLYSVDDYLHGVKDVWDHPWRLYYDRPVLRSFEQTAAECDGLIVSTPFLLERYGGVINEGPAYLCPNGIEPSRFSYTRPSRPFMTLGWAGGAGHLRALVKWFNAGLLDVLYERPTARFTAIGHPLFAEEVDKSLGWDGRCVGVPWLLHEQYPAAMADCDVLIAPADDTKWSRAHSDLRWLEASALGIPCVCDSRRYPDAYLGAKAPELAADIVAMLLDQPDTARNVGAAERDHVLANRSFPDAAQPWREALDG